MICSSCSCKGNGIRNMERKSSSIDLLHAICEDLKSIPSLEEKLRDSYVGPSTKDESAQQTDDCVLYYTDSIDESLHESIGDLNRFKHVCNNNTLQKDKKCSTATASRNSIDESLHESIADLNRSKPICKNNSPQKKKRRSAVTVSRCESIRSQRIYTECVSVPSYYREQKNAQRGTFRWFLRKTSGIPLSFMYGILLIWIISNIIMGKPGPNLDLQTRPQERLSKNVCATIFAHALNDSNFGRSEDGSLQLNDVDFSMVEELFDHVQYSDETYTNSSENFEFAQPIPTHSSFIKGSTNETTRGHSMNSLHHSDSSNKTKQQKTRLLFENDSVELYLVTGAVMGATGLTSLFSRNTRATLLLILPGLATRHSRHLIFTIVLGMLSNGPLTNLRLNFNKVLKNAACMYRSGLIVSCIKQQEIHNILEYARNIYREFQNIKDSFNKVLCPGGTFDYFGRSCTQIPNNHPFPHTNSTLDVIQTLTAPSTQGIKKQATIVINRISVLGNYIDIVRRSITIISVLVVIVDAIRYLRSYLTDSSFDNLCIDRDTRKYWKTKEYCTNTNSLTYWNVKKGLRNWELNQGFKTLVHPKFTRKEVFKAWRNGISTFIFFVFVMIVLFVDFFLAEALEYVKENQRFSIAFKSKDLPHNMTTNVHIRLLNFNTRSCLSSPSYTPGHVYWTISALLAAAAISCILEVYMCGIRAKLCQLFYPDRSEERADYLYYRIFTGRLNRKSNLLLLVRREIERQEKLIKFSPWKRLKHFMRMRVSTCKATTIKCPGCGWKEKSELAKDISFDAIDKVINTTICRSCEQDLCL